MPSSSLDSSFTFLILIIKIGDEREIINIGRSNKEGNTSVLHLCLCFDNRTGRLSERRM